MHTAAHYPQADSSALLVSRLFLPALLHIATCIFTHLFIHSLLVPEAAADHQACPQLNSMLIADLPASALAQQQQFWAIFWLLEHTAQALASRSPLGPAWCLPRDLREMSLKLGSLVEIGPDSAVRALLSHTIFTTWLCQRLVDASKLQAALITHLS